MNITLNINHFKGIDKMKFKPVYLYWLVPILVFIPQLWMTLNSFNQLRFEELIESVQAPFWLDSRLIINGLHVNVGWYAYLLGIYKLFGFSLYTGKIANLSASFVSTFCLAFFLKRFFNPKVAALILVTVVLSPTLLFINTLSLHWAMTYHLMLVILLLLTVLDFRKRRQSLILTVVIFLLIMITWFFYQAVVFYIPSLVLFYFFKLKKHFSLTQLTVPIVAFLLPLIMLFSWVKNKQLLILDPETGSGLFRGGGKFVFSSDVFSQAWTDFINDFFVKGVSHHYEVSQAEFSLIFPIITLIFMIYALGKIWKRVKNSRKLILLALLVIAFDILIFSTTSDLGLPGMKRVTPMLFSIYFLWVLVWWWVEKRGIRVIGGIWVIRGILGLFLIHHLIVYPINLIHIKDHSPFKVTDWFDPAPYGAGFDEYVRLAQKDDLLLDCRPIVAQLGQCSYDFIYPAVEGACKWNHLNCHTILGYDVKDHKFVPLSLDLWQSKFFER